MNNKNKEGVIKVIRTIGKVIEVFIPEQFKNGNLLDEMDRTNIGFKVMNSDGIKEVIVEQNEINASIMKNDMVMITEQTIDGIYFVDIELYDGEEYE